MCEYTYIYIYMCIYMCIYKYRYREKERVPQARGRRRVASGAVSSYMKRKLDFNLSSNQVYYTA